MIRAVLLGVIAFAAVACGSDASDGGPQTLVVAEDGSPRILNVLLPDGLSVVGQRVVSNIQQNLLTSDENGAFVPQLAVAVPNGADVRTGPLRVTFRLQPEARWSDGRPVTATDVAFTWRTMTDERNVVASRAGWEEITAIRTGRTATGASCPAATCFTVAFRSDYAPWRDIFSTSGVNYILPEHVLADADFNTAWNAGGIIGSGPYVLESNQPGVRAVLRRDPDYWGEGPAADDPPIDRIVIEFLASSAAALAAVREGQAQMATLPPDPDAIRRARQIAGTTTQSVPSLFFEHIAINTRAAPLDDPAVRRALAYALDRREIVDVLLDGTVPVLQSPIRPGQLGYTPAFGAYDHDPARAIALLQAAGWSRQADGLFSKGGRALRIDLLFDAGNPLRASTGRLIARQARAAGIAVEPRAVSPGRLFGEILNGGDFQAVMLAVGGGVDPSLTSLLATAEVPTEENEFAGQNVYRWSEPEADSLMRRSDRQIDDDARAATLAAVQRLLAESVPLIPLYQQPNALVATTALRGVRVNPTQSEAFWNSAGWSLRE